MEGRNREVRRLWESQDLTVSRLKRTRYGSFFIPSSVKSGKSIELKGRDVDDLYLMAGVEPMQQKQHRQDYRKGKKAPRGGPRSGVRQRKEESAKGRVKPS